MGNIDTEKLNTAVDLRDLAALHTTLHKHAAGELAGPCPKCGGTDRFHVKADWWYCNQCYHYDNGEPHDAIAFIRWLDGCDFVTACQKLGSGDLPAATHRREAEHKPKAWRGDDWQRKQKRTAREAIARLATDAGQPGRDYLTGRGLRRETWEAFKVGFITWRRRGWPAARPGVVIPWVIGGHITALKIRFTDTTGAEREQRYDSPAGGEQTLFGTPLAGSHWDTLILCEGELNAMSLWQTVQDIGHGDHVDVLSFGAEGGAKSGLVVDLARKYRRVVVWVDQGDKARDLAGTIGGDVLALQSPEIDGKKYDANDALQAGLLADVLARFLSDRQPQTGTSDNKLYTMIWPVGSNMGVIDGKWKRLDSGEIEATYTRDELEAALFVAEAWSHSSDQAGAG